MKTLQKISVLLFLSILVSCGGDDDSLGISGESSFSAKVDGTTFTALSAAVSATVSNGVGAIQGSNADGDFIRINIMSYDGTGTYITGDSPTNVNSLTFGNVSGSAWVSTFNLGSGTIEITEDTDTSISGTFSFTGINSSDNNSSKTVTEGTFNAPKQ